MNKKLQIIVLAVIFFLPSFIQADQFWPDEISSIWRISESPSDDTIWITFIDEKQNDWWLLYRGWSSELEEHRNTISICEAPLGEDSMVPMFPLDADKEKEVLSIVKRYFEKLVPSKSDEYILLKKLLDLKSEKSNNLIQDN